MSEEFDWDAYYRDTRRLSPEARGVWMDCLYHMRLSPTRGRISEPLEVYVTMFGSKTRQAQRVIDEIEARRIADVVREESGYITIINRRMFREWQEKQDANYRQAKHRYGFVTELSQKEMPENGISAESVTAISPNKNEPLEVVSRNCHGIVTKGSKTPSYKRDINTEIKETKSKRPKSTRIPDPFPVSPPMLEWARINCPGLLLETAHESFIEYWTNNTTSKANKVDWQLTWQKGMKLALKWQKEAAFRGHVGKHIETPGPVIRCSECNDLGNIWVEVPADRRLFTGETEMKPCPDCVAIAA